MPLGKELSHIVEEQIKKSVVTQSTAGDTGSVSASGSNNGDKIALIEANVQRLAEQLAQMVSTQKKSKRNQIEYGLEVHALHGMRIAVTSGQVTFKELEEPLDCPFMYLELSPSLSGRQIRYIYLTPEATLVESTTDPSDMEEYIPLAMVDVWAEVNDLTEDKVQDIRPRANGVTGDFKAKELVESILTGNVTVFSTDTGKDSFVIRETDPPSMKVFVTSGRALVDGEVINAEGGDLDLSGYCKVDKEYVGIGDGEKSNFSLYHQHVKNLKILVSGEEREATVDEENGQISFEEPIEEAAEIRASYDFTGNCMVVFFVEKIYADTGKSLGIIGWATGSNRTPQEPPKLLEMQHVIGKAELSDAMATITDMVIDNSYEVVNLTQEELQYGEKLGSTSLQDGAIIARKISANSIIGDHIAAGSIDAAKIVSGAIESQHISAGAILAQHIAADTITADMIKGGIISADKFESSTWGDLTQAIRYVKSILKGQNFWRKPFTKGEIASGVLENVSCDTEEYPTLRLKNTRKWDPGHGIMPTIISNLDHKKIEEFHDSIKNYFLVCGKLLFFLEGSEGKMTVEEFDESVSKIDKEIFAETLVLLHAGLFESGLIQEEFEVWIQSENLLGRVIGNWAVGRTYGAKDTIISLLNNPDIIEWAWRGLGGTVEKHPSRMNEDEIRKIIAYYFSLVIEDSDSTWVLIDLFRTMKENALFNFYSEISSDPHIIEKYEEEMEKINSVYDEVLNNTQITLGKPIAPWDEGTWDRPVEKEGSWESPSIDYGKQEDLQAEFWVKPLLISSDHSIQVKFKYSEDNKKWTNYEEGAHNQAVGYYYWVGNFQNYRYVKVKVEMKTANTENYEIMAYPEIRIASATQGNVGDIRFPAMTVKPGELKLNGALLKRQDYPLLWSWACENYLVVSETERSANGFALRGLFTSGDGTTTFRVPDMRSQFLRVLSEGHGDDPDVNRRLGWRQSDAIRNITGTFALLAVSGGNNSLSGAFGSDYTVANRNYHLPSKKNGDGMMDFKASRVVPTATENRPRNLAYFACIRYS